MVRLLRKVVRLGLLAGLGVGVVKAIKGRKAPDPWAESWVSTGTPGATRPSVAPVAAAAPVTPAAPAAPIETTADAAADTDAQAGADAEEGDRAATADSATAKPPPPTRAAKPTRTGPARKSPTGKAEGPPGERLWVPANEGVCPQSHPVKAKLSSKIFHTPASRNYSRTKADRCYSDEASAQADGLRPAQR